MDTNNTNQEIPLDDVVNESVKKASLRKRKEEKDPERVTKWFAAHPPKSEKDGEIELKRLSVEKVHYAFLTIWFIISLFAGRVFMLFYAPDPSTYAFNNLMALGFAAACLCFVFFSLLAAKQHSRQFDTNIITVFEYMLRQDKTVFSYRERNRPAYESAGRHVLYGIFDDENQVSNSDSYKKSSPGSDVVIKLRKIVHAKDARKHDGQRSLSKEFNERISNIEEITIGSQGGGISSPEYLKKNNKIRQMLLSDRSQLIAFVSMYIFGMLAGGLLGYGI